MKKLIKFLVLIMCLCFVTSSLFACAPQVSEFKLKEHYFSIYEGDSRAIETISEANLSYTYEVGDSEVISVSDNGVVTAIKAGSSAVTVKSGDKTDTLMVEVIANERFIKLNINETSKVVGSTFDIIASVYVKGSVSEKTVQWQLSTDVNKIVNGNILTLTPASTGEIIVTAVCDDLTATCKVKIVNVNSSVLSKPNVVVTNCKTLTWDAVENATEYSILIGDSEVVSLPSTTTSYDVPQVSELKNSEKITVAVRAKSSDFNFIDSELCVLTLSHDFIESSIGEPPYSCTQAGSIKYDCACGVNYTVSNYVDKHNYVDGRCADCGNVQSEGVIYAYNAEIEAYYIAGVQDGFASDELYALSSYDNGKDGEAPVVYVGFKAFYMNTKLRKIILPKSVIGLEGQAFSLMSNLEYLSIPGLVHTTGAATYQFGEKSITFPNSRDNWTDTYNLRTIIVGEGFRNDCRSFFIHLWSPDSYKPILDVFVDGQYVENIFSGSTRLGLMPTKVGRKDGDNYQLTGNIYYYDETGENCGHWWHYDENGYAVKNEKEHTIRESVCIDCGYVYNKNFHFKWKEELQAYEFMCVREGYDKAVIDNIPTTYNDGVHGEANVVSVGTGAFWNMGNLKKVVLPDTITLIESNVFGYCSKLEEIIMPGVKTVRGSNNFIDCIKLSKIVVSNEYKLNTQSFHVQLSKYSTYVPILDAYLTTQEEGSFSFTPSGNNNMVTGTIYFYNENPGTTHGLWWNFDDNGNVRAISNPHVYDENDVCYCGQVNPHGLKYSYDSASDSYYVAGILSSNTDTIINVLSEYADGVDGRIQLRPVTRIGELAFSGNTSVTKIVLPMSVTSIGQRAFMNCSKLETLEAPGVVTFEHKEESTSQTFQFAYCEALKTVILSGDITSFGERIFYNDKDLDKDGSIDYEKQTNVYLTGVRNNVNSIGPYNQLLTGNIYCYKENPGNSHGYWWNYNTDNKIEITVNEHKLQNGECECGYIDPAGVLYKYINGSYTVIGLSDNTLKKVEILSQYNDGENGKANVTAIGASAFKGTKVEVVVLPETVTSIADRAFMWCYDLTTVIAPGVKEFNDPQQLQFVYCDSLVNVVLNAETTNIPSRVFLNNTGLKEDGETYYGNNQADILINDSVSKVETISKDNNQILTGDVYVYSTDITKHGKVWSYDKDGNIVKADNPHEFNDDLICGCGASMPWDSKGINYEWDSVTSSYIVKGLTDNTLTEIEILGEFSDGVHGKANVTTIGERAFAVGYPNYNTTLKKIVIHENVKTIKDRAFMWLMGVEFIDARGVDTLDGTFHFAYCESLKTVVLGGNLTSLQNGTFFDDAKSEPDLNRPFAEKTVSLYLYSETNKVTNISNANGNEMLNTEKVYCYSSVEKANCWRYVDGVPTLWGV